MNKLITIFGPLTLAMPIPACNKNHQLKGQWRGYLVGEGKIVPKGSYSFRLWGMVGKELFSFLATRLITAISAIEFWR
jgi:hypothetical protein